MAYQRPMPEAPLHLKARTCGTPVARGGGLRAARGLVPLLVASLLLPAGCSSLGKAGWVKSGAARGLYPTLTSLVEVGMEFDDLVLLQSTLEADLLLVETLAREAPGDRRITVLLSKLYANYSFGFVVDEDLERGRKLYWKGIDHGMKALRMNRRFARALDEKEPIDEAVRHLRYPKDLTSAFWTAMNMGMLLICSLDVPEAMILGDTFKALNGWVIDKEGDYFHGAAHSLIGVYDAIIPRMLGGGPEKAREAFERAIAIDDNFLLHYYLYARYVPTLVMDEDHFDELLRHVYDTPSNLDPSITALNEVAKRKARLLDENRNLYF